jgi:hypothetical protein
VTALPAYPGRFDTTQIANADEISARLKHAPGWLVDARARERFRGEVETIMQRWEKELKHDPAYNPNLTLELTDFTLAAPPRPWVP